MGARRLLVLVKGLPEDSALRRAWTKGWSQQNELLATIAEVVSQTAAQTVFWLQMVAAGHGRIYPDSFKPEVPDPVLGRFEHPGRPRPPPRDVSTAVSGPRLAPKLTPALARSVGLL